MRELLETLKREKLVLDWRKKQQTQAAVRKTVRDIFNAALPPSYTKEICDETYVASTSTSTIPIYSMDRSVYAA